jgi:hypothetical protein
MSASTNLIAELRPQLSALHWSDRATSHRAAQRILQDGIDVQAPLTDLGLSSLRDISLRRSVEKTTHFKWFLAEDESGFEIWLHQYKPASHRRLGHAAVAHNHRFWFTSIVLRGGFISHTYEAADPSRPAALERVGKMVYERGDSYVLDPSTIHSLSDIQEPTVSLLVQSRPIRPYSDVYENGKLLRYHDLDSQFDTLLVTL